MARLFLSLGMVLALVACTSSERGLRDLRSPAEGPDEFQVNPTGPLELPTDISTLPQPTPGGANRTDATPQADAVAVLGGNPAALVPNGIPTSDRAIVQAASRNGVDPAIRQTLAAEDAQLRQRRSRLRFFGGRDRYFQAYAFMSLDAYAELQRFRNAGVATPSAPPGN